MVHIVGQVEFDCDIEALSEEIEKAGYVKVVRCKDCKFFSATWDGLGVCRKIPRVMMREYDYCGWGERRKNDGAAD